MTIGHYFRNLFAGAPDAAPRTAAPVAGRSQQMPQFGEITDRLNRMLWERRSILSGNIHLVGLSRIRERLGTEWPRLAERAQDIAQKAIQRVCGPDDVFTRYDDFSFLIIFSNLTREQAQLRCVEIAEDIGRRLLGENFLAEAAEVRTGVFETDGTLVFNAVDKQDLVGRLLEHTEAAQREDALATEVADDDTDLAAFRLDKARALGSIRILYQPMWNPRHRAIAGCFATATAESVFGKQLWDEAIRSEFASILPPAEFDAHIVRTAMRSVAHHMAQGNRILIGWPIHFETLAIRSSREAYIQLCRDIPEAIRQLLVFELVGLPEGVPASRIVDVTGVLRPFCRMVILRVSWDFRRFDILQGRNIGAVGFSLPGGRAGDAQGIAQIARFAEGIARTGLRGYIHGVASRAEVLAAAAAGYEWVDGPAVQTPAETPARMHRFGIEDLYRPLQAA